VAGLCARAAQDVRECEAPFQVHGAVPAIRRAHEGLAWHYDPPPVRIAQSGPCPAHAGIFEGLRRDFPGRDWRIVCFVEIDSPTGGQPSRHYFLAQAASGEVRGLEAYQPEYLLGWQGREDLAAALDSWARHLSEGDSEPPSSSAWDFREPGWATYRGQQGPRRFPLEYRNRRLLECLANARGRGVAMKTLMEAAAGDRSLADGTLRGYLSNLRSHLRQQLNLPDPYDPIPYQDPDGYRLDLT
jgi:hypothetical protein